MQTSDSGMPLKLRKRNCFNTASLSEKMISFTVYVSLLFFSFFLFFFFFFSGTKYTFVYKDDPFVSHFSSNFLDFVP